MSTPATVKPHPIAKTHQAKITDFFESKRKPSSIPTPAPANLPLTPTKGTPPSSTSRQTHPTPIAKRTRARLKLANSMPPRNSPVAHRTRAKIKRKKQHTNTPVAKRTRAQLRARQYVQRYNHERFFRGKHKPAAPPSQPPQSQWCVTALIPNYVWREEPSPAPTPPPPQPIESTTWCANTLLDHNHPNHNITLPHTPQSV